MADKKNISVIVPLWNEDESLRPLHEWIQRVMLEHDFKYEIIFVNDGSTDRSWNVIQELHNENSDTVRGICFRRNYGKSPALYCGFEAAEGEVAGLAKANEALAKIRAGEAFDDVMVLYNEDASTPEQMMVGYPISESTGSYGEEFKAGAMALANVGDVST